MRYEAEKNACVSVCLLSGNNRQSKVEKRDRVKRRAVQTHKSRLSEK